MSGVLHIHGLKKQRPSSLLGLALDGSRLEGVVLRRTNGTVRIERSFSVSLSLDALTADAELVGREIRNHLDAAGVRERCCVVGVPLKWALTTHIELPELPEAELAGLLQIEAERGFHSDVATLQVAISRWRLPSGKQHALMVGVPKNHLASLEEALRAAKLRPVAFSLGIAALQPPEAEKTNGVLALAIGESQVGLQVTGGGGVVALRALEGALEVEGSERKLHAEVIAREARITLGQLPAELRETVRQLRVFGPRDLAQQLADEMELRLEAMGLKVEAVPRYSANQFGLQLPSDAPVSAPLSLAAAHLAGRSAAFDLLPPKVTPWQQLASRYSSGRLRMAGAAATTAVLVLAGLFFYQDWQLRRYRSQWSGMSAKVGEAQKLQQQIRQFRPWFDDSVRGLRILRQLTTAFPEDGVVSAKTIEIRDLSAVTCTGVARDNRELLKTMDRISASPGVMDFHEGALRGKSPLQFTFSFAWNDGARSQ
jgi:hypothetical protein